MREACREADILEEVLLDCQRMCDEAAARPDVGADFKPRLPKAGLTAAQLAVAHVVAHALHRKRLEWAEAENVPMGRVLSNMAISDIAVKPPGNLKELARASGVRGVFVRAHGEEVLALVHGLLEKARKGELPQEVLEPKAQRDPNRRRREEVLKAWRSEKAATRKVTPSVVLPNPLFDTLVSKPPRDEEELRAVPYLGEKRVRLYGEELLSLLGQYPAMQ